MWRVPIRNETYAAHNRRASSTCVARARLPPEANVKPCLPDRDHRDRSDAQGAQGHGPHHRDSGLDRDPIGLERPFSKVD